MKIERVCVAFGLITIVGCTHGEDANVDTAVRVGEHANSQPDSAQAWTVRPTKNYLTCSPDTVGPNDVLVLRMDLPHGSSFHIGSPDGTPYLIVFHGAGQPDRGQRRSLMTPESFAALRELRVAVRELTGGVWVFGRDTNEVVFRAPGVYRLRVGNDMETDGPDYAECLVRYVPKP